MQASTGQYSTQAGEPAHPVQLSRITARILGFFFLRSGRPCDIGSNFTNGSINSAASAIVSPKNDYVRVLPLDFVNVNLPQNQQRTKGERSSNMCSA